MELTVTQLGRMMDLSSVRADVDYQEICQLAETAKRFNCIVAYSLPCYIAELVELLADAPEVGAGAAVGFPSGGHTTEMKQIEARHLCDMGIAELDMVANIGWIKSGRDDAVVDDIRAVVDAADGIPVKVIIECHWLTDDEICRATELCIRGRADWVKTGTGWPPTGATLENCALIKKVAGDAIHVKASGGVRDNETACRMAAMGIERFGVGLNAGTKMLEELAAMPGGKIVIDQ